LLLVGDITSHNLRNSRVEFTCSYCVYFLQVSEQKHLVASVDDLRGYPLVDLIESCESVDGLLFSKDFHRFSLASAELEPSLEKLLKSFVHSFIHLS